MLKNLLIFKNFREERTLRNALIVTGDTGVHPSGKPV